jgi:hypothetical protein
MSSGFTRISRSVLVLLIAAALAAMNIAAARGSVTVAAGHAVPAATVTCGASTQPAGYGPAQLQSAYRLPSASSGAGMLVAVVAPYDDPDVAGDLCVYRTQYGLAPCTTADTCFTEVNENGAASPLPGSNPTWGLSTSAQLDMISATCPNCRILLVETTSASIADVGAGVNTAVSMGADVVTIGVAAPEASNDKTLDADYFNHPGVVITAAAGNNGYGVSYPAASLDVTAVGGTSLAPDASGACPSGGTASPSGWCETVWNDLGDQPPGGATGSGCTAYESKPSWQTDTGCANRTDNDLAADADPATGVAVYDSDGENGWQPVPGIGGTAVSAAIVAGEAALAGPGSGLTSADPYTRRSASSINDITSGTSEPAGSTCAPAYLCTAGTGYDGPSGLGSPSGVTALTSGELTFQTIGGYTAAGLTGVIRSAVFGKCLENENGLIGAENPAEIYTCNAKYGQQQWAVQPDGTIRIMAAAGELPPMPRGQCLSAAGTALNSEVELGNCTGSGTQWIYQSSGLVVNPASGLCLDDPSGSTTDGTQLQIRACGTFPAQEWSLPYTRPASPAGEIVAQDTGMCLDNLDSKLANANVVDVYTCNGGQDSQEWTVEGDGTIRLTSAYCLDVYHSGDTSGSIVDLYTCNGSDSQQWQQLSDGALYNPESGLCLTGDGTEVTQLEVQTCDQASDQSWTLPRSTPPS